MERFDFRLSRGRQPAFDDVPAEHKRTVFGVEYVHLKGRQQGDMYFTPHGWRVAESLLPEQWFVGKKFSRVGKALAGATGAVYRVPVPHPGRKDFALVIKFSRVCQTVGITDVDPRLQFSHLHIDRIKSARFLSPFEEFGNLYKLRRSAGLEIPTKAPLAIYSPPTRYLDWQLGREPHLKSNHSRRLLASQEGLPPEQRLDYDWERLYILIYRWLNGVDAEQAYHASVITEERMIELGLAARAALEKNGWEVYDHKPRHVIVRKTRRKGRAASSDGLIWGLIDYELLYPLVHDEPKAPAAG